MWSPEAGRLPRHDHHQRTPTSTAISPRTKAGSSVGSNPSSRTPHPAPSTRNSTMRSGPVRSTRRPMPRAPAMLATPTSPKLPMSAGPACQLQGHQPQQGSGGIGLGGTAGCAEDSVNGCGHGEEAALERIRDAHRIAPPGQRSLPALIPCWASYRCADATRT